MITWLPASDKLISTTLATFRQFLAFFAASQLLRSPVIGDESLFLLYCSYNSVDFGFRFVYRRYCFSLYYRATDIHAYAEIFLQTCTSAEYNLQAVVTMTYDQSDDRKIELLSVLVAHKILPKLRFQLKPNAIAVSYVMHLIKCKEHFTWFSAFLRQPRYRSAEVWHALSKDHIYSLTCYTRVYLRTEWTIPRLCFPAEAGSYFPTLEGCKAELA